MRKNSNLKECLRLFLTFFKIGSFTFGGGHAMIPLIQREAVEKNRWITNEDVLDIIAVAESTPGPIAINSATFIGYQTAGFFGAFSATLGVVLPSFIIILIISNFLRQFESIKVIQLAFNGIRAGVLALVVKALVSLYKQCPKNLLSYIIMALAFTAATIFNVNVLIVILCSGLIGLAVSLIAKRGEGK